MRNILSREKLEYFIPLFRSIEILRKRDEKRDRECVITSFIIISQSLFAFRAASRSASDCELEEKRESEIERER